MNISFQLLLYIIEVIHREDQQNSQFEFCDVMRKPAISTVKCKILQSMPFFAWWLFIYVFIYIIYLFNYFLFSWVLVPQQIKALSLKGKPKSQCVTQNGRKRNIQNTQFQKMFSNRYFSYLFTPNTSFSNLFIRNVILRK